MGSSRGCTKVVAVLGLDCARSVIMVLSIGRVVLSSRGNTAAHCQAKTVVRMAMLKNTWWLLQGIYAGVKKHAYTERGQKCTRAYIKRVHNVGN